MTRYKLLAGLAFFCMGAFLFDCSDDVVGPENSGPVIDSIFTSPDSVLPGAVTVLSASVTDPDGDSLTYRWSTYPAAAKFSDTTAAICTLTVATVLEGGMFLKVTLRVSDGKNEVSRDRWISLIRGEFVHGHVYYEGTKIQIPFVEVSIGQLVDTNRYSDGYYAIRNVPTGQQTILSRLLGCDFCCDSYAANIISSGIDTLNHDIFMICEEYLHPVTGMVIGSVLDGDTIKLENIRVTLINRDSSETGICDTTDQDGRFNLDGVPEGFRGFVIEDIGSPIYEVFPTFGWFSIPRVNNNDAVIRAMTKRTYVISDGIADTTGWILEDDLTWKSWVVDTLSECLSFNTCLDGGLGKISMADSIPLPSKARNITVIAEFSLNNASMYIGYLVDGQEVLQEPFFAGTVDWVFEIDVEDTGVRPAGHDFGLQFYIVSHTDGPCGFACLKYLEISYTLPTY